MERYYKASEVEAIICKLMREPYYQHDGEDFKAGVSAIEGELMFLDTIELEEHKQGKWQFAGDGIVECSVCEEAYDVDLLPRNYCPNCGAKMIKE